MGRGVKGAVVVQGHAQEARLGPERIDHRAAFGVQVEAVDVFLPVENVGKVHRPEDQFAGAAGVQVVVVAEEPGRAVVGDVDVVAALGPEDVIADLDGARPALDPDEVAGGGEQGVVEDANVGLALDVDAAEGVAVQKIVGDELAAVGGDADGVARDPLELDRAGEVHAGDVRLDQVGMVEVVGDELAGAGHAGGVGEDVLALHPAEQVNAGAVVENLVGRGGADEAEAVDAVRHQAEDPGGVVGNAVAAQGGGRLVGHAHRAAVEGVGFDQAGEGGADGEDGAGGGGVVAGDVAGHGDAQLDAGAAGDDAVVAQLQAGGAAGADHGHARAADGRNQVMLDRRPGGALGECQGGAGGVEGIVDHLRTRSAVQDQAGAREAVVGEGDAAAAQQADRAAEAEVFQDQAGGVVQGGRARDDGRQLHRAEEQQAGVGGVERQGVAVIAAVHQDHVAGTRVIAGHQGGERRHRRLRAAAVIGVGSWREGEATDGLAEALRVDETAARAADGGRGMNVINGPRRPGIAAHVDLRAARAEVVPGHERVAVGVDGQGGRRRGFDAVADAAVTGVAGNLLGEFAAVPELGVQGDAVAGAVGDAVAQPHQV